MAPVAGSRDLPCSRARDPGRRRKGEESRSAPRGTLAQGAFQLRRLQPRPARSPEAPQPETGTPPPPGPRSPPGCWGAPGLRVRTAEAPNRAEIERQPRAPELLPAASARPRRRPPTARGAAGGRPPGAGRAGVPRSGVGRSGNQGYRPRSVGALSGPKRSSEPRASRAPGLPSSAPDSQLLGRPRGGAADSSRRLPASSISPFSP